MATSRAVASQGRLHRVRTATDRHGYTSLNYRYLIGCAILFLCISQFWYWTETIALDDSNSSPTAQFSKENVGYKHGVQNQSKIDHDDRLRYQPKRPPEVMSFPASTWTCTLEGDESQGARKSRQCVVHHVCVDDQGLFLLSQDDKENAFPKINVMSSRESAEYYWEPRFKPFAGQPITMYYKKETIFVYGLFQPGHFSHFLYDGLLPLYSTMKRFGGTGSSWLLRQAEYLGENLEEQTVWEMDAVLPSGQEIVLKDFEVVSPFQVLPPKRAPICFDRAVIGLGSQCGLDYCAKNTPTEIYQAYSEQVRNHYWPTVKRWNLFLESRAQEELERQREALGKDVDFSPTKCLQTARYYNFEGDEDEAQGRESSLNLTPAHDEPILRRGEIDPDSVDRLPDGKRRRRPVIAIIERRRNRAILNLDLVISTIVKSGHFRLKTLNYDQGCGIPETAYLMRDVNILISSHGNALGGSLWMPSPSTSHNHPAPVVISIDSTRYYERWFQWTTTAMGQRFILHRCGPTVSFQSDSKEPCALHRDLNLARKILEKVGLTLDEPTQEEDLLTLTGAEFPLELWARYRDRDSADEDGQGGWLEKVALFLGDYWKNLARYADPDRLLETLEKIRLENEEDNDYENTQSNPGNTGNADNSMRSTKRPLSYLRLCMQGRCCGPDCEGVMNRNVVGPMRAYDQDISEGHWGEFLPNEEQAEFVRSGERLKSWIA